MEMKRVYLSLAAGTGWLFEEKKTPTEGFEEHTYTPKSGKNKDKTITTYRKYHKFGIFGNFLGAKAEEFEKVWYLKIAFEHDIEGVQYIVNFPVHDQKGNINSFTQGFASYLPGLEVGRAYKFNPYVDDREARKKYGIVMWYAQLSNNAIDDKNKPPRLTLEYTKKNANGGYDVVPGDIPMTDWVQVANENSLDENAPALKNVPDNKRKNAYLTKILKEHKKGALPSSGAGATFDSTQSGQSAPTQSAQSATPAQPVTAPAGSTATVPSNNVPDATVVEEDDDLPF